MSETTAEHGETQYDPHADPQWSEDGHYWWDGGKWITAAEREAELEQIAQQESDRVEAARAKAEQAREERARAAEEKAARVQAARAEAQAQREQAAARREAEREAAAAQREAERIAAAEAEAAEARAAEERAEESARLQATTAALAAERRAEAARAKAEAAAQKRAQAAAARAQAAQAKADAAAARASTKPQQPQAKSTAVAATEPQRAQASTTTLPEDRSAVRLWTRVVLALVLVLVVLAGFLVALLHKKSTPTTPAAPGGTVGSTLLAARDAEQKYHDKNARYTGSILDLTPLGFRPAKGVTLTVLHADAGTYCLSGAKGTEAYYLSSADPVVSRTPCS